MNPTYQRLIVNAVCCFTRGLLLAVLAVTLVSPRLHAQAGANGSIGGVISNSATNQFLDRAEVKIDGTNRSALTDRDGSYRIGELAAGVYNLTVTYGGLDTDKETVTVKAGATTTRDFAMTSGIYKLEKFVVATEVEGNAAQVNKQKKADFFMTAISADSLGEVPDGNIGEFLRYVPGLQVNYVNADASTVSVRGQDPEATTFTIDGQIPAAAGTPPRSSTGSSDQSSRAFEFTQASITNIESVEVFKAPPPWLAPSTGGVINAVTKNAFSQKGRVFRVVTGFNVNSDMLKFGQVEGPGQGSKWRIKPSASMTYSEALLNHTLGVTFVYGESHTINPTHNNSVGYGLVTAGTTAAPATDASPVRADTFTLVDGPEAKHKRNASLNFDYKLGTQTVLKFNVYYNYSLRQSRQHTFRLRPIAGATGSTFLAGSNETDTTVINGQVDVFADYSDALSQNIGYVGVLEQKIGERWKFTGSAAYSKSDSKTVDLPEFINSVQFNLTPARGVSYRLQASPDRPAPTVLTQIAGPDLYDLNNYNQSSLSVQTQPRFQNDRTINLQTDLRGAFPEWRFPVEFRAGGGLYRIARRKAAGQIVLDFRGIDGIAASGDEILNASQFSDTTYGDKFLYGIKTPPLLDPYKTGEYMRQNPLAFQNIQPTNVQRQAVNSQSITQDIPNAYAAFTAKLSSRLTLLGGLRYERTENFARGAFRQNSLGVGLPANSIQFFQAVYSQTKKYESSYEDYFPNYQLTYRITPDIIFRAAATRSLSRPKLQDILPNTTVNDTANPQTITVTNSGLLPTYSNNLDAGFDYYPTPNSAITVGWFRKKITNYIITETIQNLQPNDPSGLGEFFSGYNLTTQDNGGTGRFEGLELSLRQDLQTVQRIPAALRGLGFLANYTKSYKAEAPNRNGVLTVPVAPNFYEWSASYGISYNSPSRTYYAQIRTTIQPSAVNTYANGTTETRNTYEARHQRWDFTLRYRFNKNYAIEFVGSNIFEDPSRKFIQGGRVTQQRDYGANYLLTFSANLDNIRLPFSGN
jgi:iron complex outermembrane recepter protein